MYPHKCNNPWRSAVVDEVTLLFVNLKTSDACVVPKTGLSEDMVVFLSTSSQMSGCYLKLG